jgi:hypothetical protein
MRYKLSGLELASVGPLTKKTKFPDLSQKFLTESPAASAGTADSRTGLRFLVTSPEGNCRGGSAIF